MNWLTRALRRPGRTAAETPWGDGLVDEGFDLLSGAADWAEVAQDELVFLSPRLRATGLPEEAARSRLLPLLGAAKARRAAGVHADDPILRSHAIRWIDLSIEAIEAGHPCPPARLLDAVALSWETHANAAYWLPTFEPMQETLAASAWLGVLCSGRPALLPRVLGDVLSSVISQAAGDGDWELAAGYLAHRIRACGLSRPLSRAFADIVSGAEVVLVRPGRRLSTSPALLEPLALALAPPAPQSSSIESRQARPGSA